MLEFARARAAVIRCFGESRSLDALSALDAAVCRIAPEELWLVASATARAEVTERVTSNLTAVDPDGLVLEQSDGWSVWTLAGDDAGRAFARLSTIPLPSNRPAFLQGAVASIPAKILALSDQLHLIVPAQLEHVVRMRIPQACADLHPRQGAEREFTVKQAAQ